MRNFIGNSFLALTGIALCALSGAKADEHGCPTYDQYYVDLGSNTFTPSLSGSVGWTFEIEIGGFADGYVYSTKKTVGCNVLGGGGCGLDTVGGQYSTVDWYITATDLISPTHVPSEITFNYKDCVPQVLKCQGHTEKFQETFPPPSTGGGILSLMFAACASGPDTRALTTEEETTIRNDLYTQQAECEAYAQQDKMCYS